MVELKEILGLALAIGWGVCVLYLFICLRRRVKRLQNSNDTIYQDEYKKRLEEPKSGYFLLERDADGNAKGTYKNGAYIPEGEDSEITYKYLRDLDEIDSGNMIF